MNKTEYNSIHEFLRKNKSGVICEHCGSNEKKLDNALIEGMTHKKDVNNYIKLCRKCHYNYDHKDKYKHSKDVKIKIGLKSKERILKNGVHSNFKYSRLGTHLSNEHKKSISEAMSGEKHHNSKLTEQDVKEIRLSILKPTELSKNYNVTYRTINNILKYKTWKNLD